MQLKKSNINRNEINEAMQKFFEQGGKVKSLPPQQVVTIYPVNGEAYSYAFNKEEYEGNSEGWNYVENRIATL